MKRFVFHAVVVLTLAACNESTQPAAPADRPAFGTMASLACPASPTFTVSDEASLRAALAAASPGAVIAIRGMIGIAADVFVTTPNVTLTCAAAGAGLFALNSSVDNLIVVDVGGSGVAVEGLVLDASAASVDGEAYFAGDFFGPGLPVPNVRFSHNTVACSPGGCTLLAGTSGAVISNNTFSSNVVTGAASGGIFARKACRNVFVGNNLQGNGSNIGLIFPDTSGANTAVGNPTLVVDNGAYDCNGDGVNDPNIITGAGAVMHGVNLGQVVSDAVSSSKRLQ